MSCRGNQKEIKSRIINCPVPDIVKKHGDQLKKQLVKVTDGVYVAVGYAMANSILLEAPDGLIIVDTTETKYTASQVLHDFRSVSDKPIRAIIYTHSHEDHIGGAQTFVDSAGGEVEIWAHEKFVEMAASMEHVLLRPAVLPRVVRQFGLGLQRVGGVPHCGIGPPMRAARLHLHWPNRIVKGQRQDVNIAGLDLTLLHIPGETPCQMGVWIPSKAVLLPGDDFYCAFPNLYAIRGTSPRDILTWALSLDVMRALSAYFMVPSHTMPVIGKQQVFHELTCYRDAIQYVHDQTVRLMNRGLHPVHIASIVNLPPSLVDEPCVQALYGCPSWSSRAVYDSYVGWFSGAVEELNPLAPHDKAIQMVHYLGEERILQAAERALADTKHQIALELSSYIYMTNPDCQRAMDIRSNALLALASQQTSVNGRNYFLSCLAEEHAIVPRDYQTAHSIKAMPLKTVMAKMQYSINPNVAAKMNGSLQVCMTLTDVDETYTLTLRNCILEVSEGAPAASDPALIFSLPSSHLKSILAGEKNYNIHCNDSRLLNTFLSAFDFADISSAKPKL